MRASLTWRMFQRGRWEVISLPLPPSSASRLACSILREFANKRHFTPHDFDVTGSLDRCSYRGDDISVIVRRLKGP